MPQGFAVSQHMEDLGFRDGDFVLAVNGEKLDNMLDVNKYLMVRDVHSITAQHADGTTQTISIPENIGETLFKSGEMQAFLPMPSTRIDSVVPNTPAAKAGLRSGDKIVSVNGQEITDYAQFDEIKQANADKLLTMRVTNQGQMRQIKLTPTVEGKIGFFAQFNINPQHKSYTLGESVVDGFSYTYWTLHDYVAQFKYVFTKKGASQLGGFGAIGSLFQPTWDWASFWQTTAFISIILAFMNILPIPALDGGHVMFLLYEMISGRKPNEKVLEYAQMVGIIILFALVLYANGNDVYRYFFK